MDPARLAGTKLFAGLTDDELAMCADRCEEIEVLPGSRVLNEGDFAYKLLVVVEGRLEVVRRGQRVAELVPGDFFGEMALPDDGRRNADVVALERSRLAKMMIWDFQQLREAIPAVAERIDATIAERAQRSATS
jgi:CRP-like cAMP-binding protein